MITWTERFVEAVSMMTGARPPQEYVQEWIDGVERNSVSRLQAWVACQEGCLWWAQGIEVLDAAAMLANSPIEGEPERIDYEQTHVWGSR